VGFSVCALYESWTIPASVMLVFAWRHWRGARAFFFRCPTMFIFRLDCSRPSSGLEETHPDCRVRKEQFEAGHDLIEATLNATRMRLRTDPDDLVRVHSRRVAARAGERCGFGSQNAIGIGVIGGMLTGTILAILFVPVFFVVVKRIFKAKVVQPAGDGDITGAITATSRHNKKRIVKRISLLITLVVGH